MNNAPKKKKKRVWPRYVLLLIMAFIVGFNLYQVLAERLAGNQVPMPFGYGLSVVMSGSMRPTLTRGDLLVVAEDTKYVPEDIVVFQTGTQPVVHRLVSITESEVITKGDANNMQDEPFSPTAIRGKVICALPKLGYVMLALKTPLGVLGAMALTVLFMEISFRRTYRGGNDQQQKLRAEIEELTRQLQKNDGSAADAGSGDNEK